jgi:hypothetical protein
MPRYYFTIRSADREEGDPYGMPLKDKAAALDHALRIVREVGAAAKYEQTGLIIVRDEMQEIVLSIPILAACA